MAVHIAGDVHQATEATGETSTGRRLFLDRGEPNRDGLSEADKRTLIIGGVVARHTKGDH